MLTSLTANTQLTYMTVHNDDILLVCSEPGIHTATQVHQLLHVRHTPLRPGKVIYLQTNKQTYKETNKLRKGM